MSIINPTLPNDGETIDAQDVNGPFNAILGLLNGNLDDTNIKPGSLPWSVMANFTNSIPASAMTDSGNLELFRQHSNISFIATGLVWSALTGLNAGMTLGKYYSNNGNLLSITAISSRTFTASKDTYVSIAQNGSIAYSEVANGAAQPALPSNSNWLAKVVTGASTVSSVTDMRQTVPITTKNIAPNSVTFDKTSGIWWEELGRTTLGSASNTISVTGLANRKFLKVLFNISSASNTRGLLRFNNISSSAYSWASLSQAVGTDSATSATGIDLYNTDTVQLRTGEIYIFNQSTLEKVVTATNVNPGAAGAGTAVGFRVVVGKWADTTNVIDRIDIVTASNTFAAGSGIVVLGHD